MADPRALLDAYARDEIADDELCPVPLEEVAPKAFAALRAVLDWCDEVERTLPVAAHELRARITRALGEPEPAQRRRPVTDGSFAGVVTVNVNPPEPEIRFVPVVDPRRRA